MVRKVFMGDAPVDNMFIGEDPVDACYLGTNLVWKRVTDAFSVTPGWSVASAGGGEFEEQFGYGVAEASVDGQAFGSIAPNNPSGLTVVALYAYGVSPNYVTRLGLALDGTIDAGALKLTITGHIADLPLSSATRTTGGGTTLFFWTNVSGPLAAIWNDNGPWACKLA